MATHLDIIEQLRRMTTPEDEYAALPETERAQYEDAEDYAAELSSDRMESDAHALWVLIREARQAVPASNVAQNFSMSARTAANPDGEF